MALLHTLKRLLTAAALLSLVAQSAEAKQLEKDADILGTWTITKVLDSADVASLTDQQAAALVGKNIVVRRDSVMFNGEPYLARKGSVRRRSEPQSP